MRECFVERKSISGSNGDQCHMENHAPFHCQAFLICKGTGDVDDSVSDDTGIEDLTAIKENNEQKANCDGPSYLKQVFCKSRAAAVD